MYGMSKAKHLKAAKAGMAAQLYRYFEDCLKQMPPTADTGKLKELFDAAKNLKLVAGKMVDEDEVEKEEEASLEDLAKEISERMPEVSDEKAKGK